MRISLWGTFAMDAFEKPLKKLQDTNLQEAIDISWAPYGSDFHSASNVEIQVIFIRICDILYSHPEKFSDQIQNISNTEEKLVHQFGQHFGNMDEACAANLVILCPNPPQMQQCKSFVSLENYLVANCIASTAKIVYSHEVLEYFGKSKIKGVDSYYESRLDLALHSPYADWMCGILACIIVRKAYDFRKPIVKVLAVDCDNTLWNGVVGEDGMLSMYHVPQQLQIKSIDKLQLDQGNLELQSYLIQQQEAGKLICLCSKNTMADVHAAFAELKDTMLLSLDKHVTCCKANWNPKADNLIDISKALNIGLESFVFLDDNPIECLQVRCQLSCVATVQIPPSTHSAGMKHFLSHVWALDDPWSPGSVLMPSVEDDKRTALYKNHFERHRHAQSYLTKNAYLSSLNLQVQIRSINKDTLNRTCQLIQRTNQFNLSTLRYSKENIEKLMLDSSFGVYTVTATDRFGCYGQIGVFLIQYTSLSLDVLLFLVSCRSLNRGIEHQMAKYVCKLAEARSLIVVQWLCKKTNRNLPAQHFAKSILQGLMTESHFLLSCTVQGLQRRLQSNEKQNWEWEIVLRMFYMIVLSWARWLFGHFKLLFNQSAVNVPPIMIIDSVTSLMQMIGSGKQTLEAPCRNMVHFSSNSKIAEGSSAACKLRRKLRHEAKLLFNENGGKLWSANEQGNHSICHTKNCNLKIKNIDCIHARCRKCCLRIQRLQKRITISTGKTLNNCIRNLQEKYQIEMTVLTNDLGKTVHSFTSCIIHICD